jgi:hypothetical protein
MLAQHAGPVADRRQIELRVGAFDLIDQAQERFDCGLAQWNAELNEARTQQLALGVARLARNIQIKAPTVR